MRSQRFGTAASAALCLVLLVLFPLGVFLTASAQAAPDYDALVHQGNAQLQAGNNDLALATANSATKLNGDRWEAYALAGGALMNLKRYEEAADDFSKAIDRAPEAKQTGLRDLRRKCLLAETGVTPAPAPAIPNPSSTETSQAEIVLWKTIENSTSPDDFKTYLQTYPNGAFAPLAKHHLDLFEQQAKSAAEAEEKQRLAQAHLAVLHIYRPNKTVACAIDAELFIDEKPTAQIVVGTLQTLALSEGKHSFFAGEKLKSGEVQFFDLQGGKEYWLRVEMIGGLWAPHGSIAMVPQKQAQDEAPKDPGKC